MSIRSLNSAFELYKNKDDLEDNTPIHFSMALSPPPLPKSPTDRFDPYSLHHVSSPNAYEPRLESRKKATLPQDLSLATVFDEGLQKMVVESPTDSAAASFGAEESPRPATHRRPLLLRRGVSRRKLDKKMKESAGIV